MTHDPFDPSVIWSMTDVTHIHT